MGLAVEVGLVSDREKGKDNEFKNSKQ
jgi:hypothetical protein